MEIQEQNKKVEVVDQVKKSSPISIPSAIVTASVIIALALILSGRGPKSESVAVVNNDNKEDTTPPNKATIKPTDYVRGDLTKAQVVIVEYSDSDCPFCQRFHTTMQEVLKRYGTKVAWIYRHFPLEIHPNATNEAYGAECAGKLGGTNAFWSYLDQVVDITVSPEKSKPILTGIATSLNINANDFTSCISSKEIKSIVDNSISEGQSLGARGTPYSIAIGKNGEQVVISGALPIGEVSKIIDQLSK